MAATVEEARSQTSAALGLPEAELEHITQELIDEYEAMASSGDGNLSAWRADGSAAAEKDVADVVEGTATYYGNHPMRLGTCLYWKTNGVGQPCGSGFTVKACNWRSAAQTVISSCGGGFNGYRFTFSY